MNEVDLLFQFGLGHFTPGLFQGVGCVHNAEKALRHAVMHFIRNPVLFIRDDQPIFNDTQFMTLKNNCAKLRQKHKLLNIPSAALKPFRRFQLHADHADKSGAHSYRHQQKVTKARQTLEHRLTLQPPLVLMFFQLRE
ncbi:hypothetical protein D3C74_364630 [compost metagenome]